MTVQLYRNNIEILPRRFERKFYLVPHDVAGARMLLRHLCLPDSDYPSEQINSLYFDTSDLDQHERSSSGDFLKDKVRIRWYSTDDDINNMETIFIELKAKEGFASTKQRLKMQVPGKNLTSPELGKGIVSRKLLLDTLARFGFFPYEMLQPIIKISYWRYRFTEVATGQRVSLDCHIRSTVIMPGLGNGERELELPGAVIEIKGDQMELPATLRRMRLLDIDWTRFSKYSACIDAHMDTVASLGRLSPSGRVLQL
jgi:hypothetical protein